MKKTLALFLVTALALAAGYASGEARLLGSWGIWPTASAEPEPAPAAAPREAPTAPTAPAEASPAPADGGTSERKVLDGPCELWPAPGVFFLDHVFALAPVPAGPACEPEMTGLGAYLEANARPYTIRPGDSLHRIGKAFKVPHALLMRLNGMTRPDILAGGRLAVLEGPFHVLVDCSDRRVILRCGGVNIKAYPAAVGPGDLTPRGTFRVESKLRNPDWTNPENRALVPFGDPENPLGTRWIAFCPGFGIHGTNDPESIGTATSRGCVRMLNSDVEELFDFLRHGASKVVIVD
jgi:hypothetical protein